MNASLEKAIQEAMADLDWLSSRWKTGTNKETDKIDRNEWWNYLHTRWTITSVLMETLMWCDTTWNKSIFTTFENFDTLLEIYLWILLQFLRFKGYSLSAEIILSNISLINSEVALQSVFKLRFYDASVCFQAKVPDGPETLAETVTLPKT